MSLRPLGPGTKRIPMGKFWLLIISAHLLAATGPKWLAERLLRKALRLAANQGAPDLIACANSSLAFLEEQKGNLSEAVAFLKTALEAGPESEATASYHCEIGILHKKLKDYQAAAKHFSEGLRLLGPEASREYKERIEEELRECLQKGTPSSEQGQKK